MKSGLFLMLFWSICLIISQVAWSESLDAINVYGDSSSYSSKIDVQGKAVFGLKSWSQALSQLPGSYVYNDGGLKLSFQGGFSHHISVIVDGVLIEDSSSPNKTFNFNSLSLDSIKSIKVLNTALSSFKTGSPFVVEIETRGANNLRVEAGSYGFVALEAQSNIKKRRAYFKLETEDGISAASGRDVENDGQKSLYFTYDVNSKYGFKANILNDEIDDGGGAINDNPDRVLNQQQYNAYIKSKLGSIKTNASVGYNIRRDRGSRFDITPKFESFNIKQSFAGPVYGFDYSLSSFFEQEKINNKKNYSSRLALLKNFKSKSRSIGFSGWGDYDNLISESWGYSVSLQQTIKPFELSVSFNRSLKKPTLSQLFDPTFGSESLNEELSHALDIGLSSYFDWLTAKAYYKKQDIDELISFDSITFRSKNIKKAKIESIGLELKKDLRSVSLGLSGDYILLANDGAGKKLNRRPRWTISSFVSAQLSRSLKLGLLYKNIGSRYDIDLNDFSRSIQLKDIKNLDLYLEKSWKQNKAYIKLNNILNDKTESINGYTVPGLQLFVGIVIR